MSQYAALCQAYAHASHDFARSFWWEQMRLGYPLVLRIPAYRWLPQFLHNETAARAKALIEAHLRTLAGWKPKALADFELVREVSTAMDYWSLKAPRGGGSSKVRASLKTAIQREMRQIAAEQSAGESELSYLRPIGPWNVQTFLWSRGAGWALEFNQRVLWGSTPFLPQVSIPQMTGLPLARIWSPSMAQIDLCVLTVVELCETLHRIWPAFFAGMAVEPVSEVPEAERASAWEAAGEEMRRRWDEEPLAPNL